LYKKLFYFKHVLIKIYGKSMKKFLSILALLCVNLASFAAIEGTYIVSGEDPYEKQPYTGTATISRGGQNGVFQISWVFDNGEKYEGTGLTSGGDEVSFAFKQTNARETSKPLIGLQLYKIDGNVLKGLWVLLDNSLLGTEELIKKESIALQSE